MTANILVAGATGNTGRGVVETLSKLFETKTVFFGSKIIATTRSLKGNTAQQLAGLPFVEVVEQSWVEITAEWLREHNVKRAFIASHNEPNQFAEESTFLVNALNAKVEYVVRISTTAANVRPDCPAYYPRTHWAIEAMLSSPAFQGLKWTSLQPNVFSNFVFHPLVEWIQEYRKTGKQGVLKLLLSETAPVGVIDPADVGLVAAHLLTSDDIDKHNQAKVVLNGPEDINGRQLVDLVEEYTGVKVEDVSYMNTSAIDQMADASAESRNVMLSIKHAVKVCWDGQCSASTTSKEVLELAAPKHGPTDFFKALPES